MYFQRAKYFLKSRTLWFNFVTLIAVITQYLPARWAAILLPITNILLRIVTTKSLTFFSE